MEYLMTAGSGNHKMLSFARYEETIDWITMERKPTNDTEKGRRYRARNDFRIKNGLLYRNNPSGDDALRVAHQLSAYDYIVGCHKAVLHKGIRKTYALVTERYYGISRDDVSEVLKHCQICALNRPNRTRAPLTPIVVEEWLQRIQIDLIDMRAEADGHAKWICHIKDHFSKYSALFALPSKEAEEVAHALSIFIMFLGIPEIMQADNGREFKGCVSKLVANHGVKVKNGRPRTPHVQGLVEQGNNSVKDSLRAWKAESGRKDWTAALPEICWSMNATLHGAIKTTPYELVFGRKFNWRNHLSHHQRVIYSPPDEPIPIEEQDAEIYYPQQNTQLDSVFNSASDYQQPGQSIDQIPQLSTPIENIPAIVQHQLQNMIAATGLDSTTGSSSIQNIPIDPALLQPFQSSSSTSLSSPPSNLPSRSPSPMANTNVVTNTPNTENLPQSVRDRATDMQNREIQARQNNTKARQDMARKYNRHHKIEIFVTGQYVTAKVPRLDRAATDNRRILGRVVEVSGSDAQPAYKLRCCYGLLKGVFPTSALASVSAVIQKEQGDSISLSSTGNEITLHQAAAQASTSNKAGVSCNCKKACNTRRCRCFKNDLKCSIYCHKSDEHDCGNLKPLSERTEISLILREAWLTEESSESEFEDATGSPDLPQASVVKTMRQTRSSTRLNITGPDDGHKV
jgi:hypothetical protein